MKQLSLDNGTTYIDGELAELEAHRTEIARNWRAIVCAMDDATRESIHSEVSETAIEFLHRYLTIAADDLVIG